MDLKTEQAFVGSSLSSFLLASHSCFVNVVYTFPSHCFPHGLGVVLTSEKKRASQKEAVGTLQGRSNPETLEWGH